ncbi:hypothetical protein ON010_g9805 [Phytophthora cinnamomi]|nr:hypothetical protein ON010_g9805 [Phytophthora cinnamomi]
MSGDSSLPVSASWFKKANLAAQYVPVVTFQRLPYRAEAGGDVDCILLVENPLDDAIRITFRSAPATETGEESTENGQVVLQDLTPIVVGPYEDPNLADAFIDDEPPFGANGDDHNTMLLQATRNLIKIKLTVNLRTHCFITPDPSVLTRSFAVFLPLQLTVNPIAPPSTSSISARFIMDTEKFDEDANEVIENSLQSVPEIRHVVGQTGCFCLDCLLHRKQEWRIGDVNTAIVGPRDQWQQYTWGNAERQCLYSDESNSATKPTLTPAISEKIRVHDSKDRIWTVDRAAKFVAVLVGKHSMLEWGMLSLISIIGAESAAVFSSGDNTYGALGVARVASTSRSAPTKVEIGLDEVGGCVKIVAASGFASFALVVLPIPDPVQRPTSKEGRQNRGRLTSLERMARGRAHSIQRMSTQAKLDVAMNAAAVNNPVLSWGRGDYGVLGHGDTQSSAAPRVIKIFNSMRVTGVSAGLHHVLVLTELDGVYAFGDGSNGKLGLGDTNPRLSPTRISSLDGLNVVHVSAGDEHSVVMSGETFFNRQVYSWGLGKNGRLGHNDELTRLKPTRVNFFRGRKVITVVAGGTHNLATSGA